MEDSNFIFDIELLTKALTQLDKKTEFGYYIINRTRNIIHLLIEVIEALTKISRKDANSAAEEDEDHSEELEDLNDQGVDLKAVIADLEVNYQILKKNEVNVIQKYSGDTTIDQKIQAVEVAESIFDEIVNHRGSSHSPLSQNVSEQRSVKVRYGCN